MFLLYVNADQKLAHKLVQDHIVYTALGAVKTPKESPHRLTFK